MLTQAKLLACFSPETKTPAGAGVEFWRREGDSSKPTVYAGFGAGTHAVRQPPV